MNTIKSTSRIITIGLLFALQNFLLPASSIAQEELDAVEAVEADAEPAAAETDPMEAGEPDSDAGAASSDPVIDPAVDAASDPVADPTIDPVVDPTSDPTIDPVVDPISDPRIDPEPDPIDPGPLGPGGEEPIVEASMPERGLEEEVRSDLGFGLGSPLETSDGDEPKLPAVATKVDQAGKVNDAAGKAELFSKGKFGKNPFFNPGSGALGVVTDFDVHPLKIAEVHTEQMSRLEKLDPVFGNGYSPSEFRPIPDQNGNPTVVRMPTDWTERNLHRFPRVRIQIGDSAPRIAMDLKDHKGNPVSLVTNQKNIRALDRRTGDEWELYDDVLSYEWNKLDKK